MIVWDVGLQVVAGYVMWSFYSFYADPDVDVRSPPDLPR